MPNCFIFVLLIALWTRYRPPQKFMFTSKRTIHYVIYMLQNKLKYDTSRRIPLLVFIHNIYSHIVWNFVLDKTEPCEQALPTVLYGMKMICRLILNQFIWPEINHWKNKLRSWWHEYMLRISGNKKLNHSRLMLSDEKVNNNFIGKF